MVQMRESLFLEKQKTVDTLRDELEQERREISIRADERLSQQLADHASSIKVEKSVHTIASEKSKFVCKREVFAY